MLAGGCTAQCNQTTQTVHLWVLDSDMLTLMVILLIAQLVSGYLH